jgi:SAM-dependent methyltransferase
VGHGYRALVELETFRWLLTDDGQALLAAATAAEGTPLQVQRALRARAEPERVAAALTQVELRARAVSKLGDDAPRMYFTRDGLEQATRSTVARHRASRVALAGPSVIDLTCGIGGDLVALARAGLTTAGVDLDPLRVEMARANLAALGLGGAVQVGDATTLDVAPFATAYADPARRSDRGRSFRADDWMPSWAFVEGLLAGRACVKVAPGLPHSRIPDGVEAEWVSFAGDVKEAVMWSPQLGTTSRRATVVAARGLATLTQEDDPGPAGPRGLGRYLFEPDGAVIRAGLVTAVADHVDGWLLDEHIAYLSADAPTATPYARCFEVLEELPFHEKQLKAALRARGVGRLTIKKRGVDVTPDRLRGRLGLQGDHEATLVMTRVLGKGTAMLVRPL